MKVENKLNNLSIPKVPLAAQGPISQLFKQQGINDFFQAVDWTHRLSYGRNSDRTNYMLIFKELCGTCSTKHAALADLAQENGIQAKLQVAICKLDLQLEPHAEPFLRKIGFAYFPEAHCYLQLEDQNIDITFPTQPLLLRAEIIEHHTILPTQIGEYKLKLHQNYLQDWLRKQSASRFSLKEIWQLREEWISILSNKPIKIK